MKVIQAIVNYVKDNPFQAAILAGLALFLIIVLTIIIVLAAKHSKTKKKAAQLDLEKKSKHKATNEAATEEKAIQPVPAPTKSQNSIKEEAPTQASVKEEPEVKTAEKTEAKKSSTSASGRKTEVKSSASKTERKEEKATPKKETAPKKNEAQPKSSKPKENSALIDELKDSLQEIDFYEEGETDKIAKYSGKWTICRVVTDENDKDAEEMYFFELHASNGEKLLSSEEYTSYNGALRGIETHKANILKDNFKITLSKKGDYIFKLLSGKNMLLCMGENYATKARCESAIESAKRFAKTAVIDENVQDHIVKVPVEDDADIAPPPDGYNGKWLISSQTAPDGEKVFYFELFANNGEKLLSSEEYTTYIGAVNGIRTHKTNIDKNNFRISLTKRGDYIYKLLNGNGQLLCLGEHYKTKRLCLNAVESVKRFALNSPVLTDPNTDK